MIWGGKLVNLWPRVLRAESLDAMRIVLSIKHGASPRSVEMEFWIWARNVMKVIKTRTRALAC